MSRRTGRADHFVTREEAQKVLDNCPNLEWKVIFALARFGGCRVPSEILPLTWADVHWDLDRIDGTSPKTEHAGKASRLVPLFPEVYAPAVDGSYSSKPSRMYQGEPSKPIIRRYRDSSPEPPNPARAESSEKAGLQVWVKPWQKLPSTSRATELVSEGWPEYKVYPLAGAYRSQSPASITWQVTRC